MIYTNFFEKKCRFLPFFSKKVKKSADICIFQKKIVLLRRIYYKE